MMVVILLIVNPQFNELAIGGYCQDGQSVHLSWICPGCGWISRRVRKVAAACLLAGISVTHHWLKGLG